MNAKNYSPFFHWKLIPSLITQMAKTFVYVTLLCIAGLVSVALAEPSYYPSYVYPVEHRSNLRSMQEESEDPANYEYVNLWT